LILKSSLLKTSSIVALSLACALGSNAFAQDKHALATELAQLQTKLDGPGLTDQLAAGAQQPLIQKWSQQLQAVPAARQQEVRSQLNEALEKFNTSAHQAIQAQIGPAAESALVPIFMEKLSDDDLRTLVTFFKSSASAKYQALGADATNAWAQKIVEATRTSVEGSASTFDAAAAKIVGAAAPAAAPSAAPKQPAAKKK
jgi:hypothetical protein